MRVESAKKITKVFSIISIVIGIFFVFAFILMNIFNYLYPSMFPFSYLYFFGNLIMVICLLIGGVALGKFKNWGRKLVLISVFIYIVETSYLFMYGVYITKSSLYIAQRVIEQGFFSFLIGVIICIFYIYFFMFNKSVKKLFKSKSRGKRKNESSN